jgi:hypothetical protein
MPTLDDLRVHCDELRAQYEELLRLLAEIDRLEARLKPSRPGKKQVPHKKRRRLRFSLPSGEA